MIGSSVIDSSVIGSSVIDSSVIGSSVIDSSVIGSSVINSSVINSSVIDSSVIDSSVIGSSVIDSSVIGSSVINSSVIGSSVIDSSVIDSSVMCGCWRIWRHCVHEEGDTTVDIELRTLARCNQQVVRYGTLAAFVESVFQPAVAPFVARLAPLTQPDTALNNGAPGRAQRADLDARDMLRTPPLMAAPLASPPACMGAAMTTPPSSPPRGQRSATRASSGTVIQAARNVFISPMGSAQVRCMPCVDIFSVACAQ